MKSKGFAVAVFLTAFGSTTIALAQVPTADFTWSPSSPQAGQPVQFIDTSTGSPTFWLWNFGDGASSTSQNPVHTFSSAASFSVSLAVSNNGGATATFITKTVSTAPPPPVANFTWSPSSPRSGQPVQFTDTSTGSPTSWSWNFGDGASSTSQNPVHTFSTAASFTVVLTATNGGGSTFITKTVSTAPPPPVANFTWSPSSPQPGQPVQFTDTSTGSPTSWSWNFGDGTSSTAQNPVHTFSSAASFSVSLAVSNNGGATATFITKTVSTAPPPPVANFTWSPSSPQPGQPVQFTDTSTGSPTSWSWNFGDGASSTSQNPVHTFSTAASFTVVLTASNGGGSTFITKTVSTAPPPPVANFTWSPSSPQPGQPVQFTDTSTGSPTSWSWNFGDGASSTSQNPVHTFSTAASFTVVLTASNGGGSTFITKTVSTAPPPPVANFTWSPSSPQPGQPVQFTDTSTGSPTSWSWNFGDGASSTSQNPVHTFSTAASFTVVLTATNGGGSTFITKTVSTAPPPPVANFTWSPSSPQPGQPVQFTDTSTGSPTSWSWNFGDGASSTSQNPVHTFSTAASFTVVLTATNGGGSTFITKTVSTAPPPPVANFTWSPSSPQPGQPVQFTDTSTGSPTSWSWNFGDGASSTSQNPVHTFSTAASFTVVLTATNGGGSTFINKTVSTAPPPLSQPPGMPTLSASTRCNTAPIGPVVSLSWTAAAGAASYVVTRNGIPLPAASSLPASQMAFDDVAVTPGASYTYSLRAINANGATESSPIAVSVSAGICGSLQAPTAPVLSAAATCNTLQSPASPAVTLAWTTSSGATTYTVYRDGTPDSGALPVSQTMFTNTQSVAAGARYTYFVRAANASVYTDSAPATVTVPAEICSTALAPVINAITPNPVPASASPQSVTIDGANFASGCIVTLRDLTAGTTVSPAPLQSETAVRLIVGPINFGTAAHNWSAQVANPNGQFTADYAFNVTAGQSGGPVITFNATPATIDAGQSSTLRWTTSGAISVSIDNGLGPQPLSGQVPVSPATDTTYVLTAVGPSTTNVAHVTVTVRAGALNRIVVGGVTFTADSIERVANGYTLSGSVRINNIIAYAGTLQVTTADSSNHSTMSGDGILSLPGVNIPGIGTVILYDGSFNIEFDSGTLHGLLEQDTKLSVAGWKLRIDSLSFVADGVTIGGSIGIPSYGSESGSRVDARVSITKSAGVRLEDGSIVISRIGLRGGFYLQDVAIGYDRDSDTFSGKGTLKTTHLGLTVGVHVSRGCVEDTTLTITGVPAVLGSTGLQLENYGVDATGFCNWNPPFGIGAHTDLTFVGNPDPDLLSFSDVHLLYYPPTSLTGGGTIRVLNADLADAKLLLNESADGVNCTDGLCVFGRMGLPTLDSAWILGEIDGRIIVNPFKMYASPTLTLQIPMKCSEMDVPWLTKHTLCVMIDTYCQGRYPCVIGQLAADVTIQQRYPQALIQGKASFHGVPFDAAVTYNEHGERAFHFHLGDYNDSSASSSRRVEVTATGGTITIAPGTPAAYFAASGAPGTAPQFSIVSPSGARFTTAGGPGVDYYVDAENGVYAVQSPESGAWTIDAGPGTVPSATVYVPTKPPTVSVDAITQVGSGYAIRWSGVSTDPNATVDLTYAGSQTGAEVGGIATSLRASAGQTTTWDVSSAQNGVYFIRARITESSGASSTFTWPTAVTVSVANAPGPPTGLTAVVSETSLRLAWQPSPTSTVTGYSVHVQRPDGTTAADYTAGMATSIEISDLDRSTGYNVSAIAYDDRGNRSSGSNVVSIAWSACFAGLSVDAPTLTAASDRVTMTARLTGTGCSAISATEWSFGDGASANGLSVSHVYATPGSYQWAAHANVDGRAITASGTIRVDGLRCAMALVQPNAGLSVSSGTPILVLWSQSDACTGSAEIDLMREGQRIAVIADAIRGGSYLWTPSKQLAGTDFHILVRDSGNAAYAAISQSFTLLGPGKSHAVAH